MILQCEEDDLRKVISELELDRQREKVLARYEGILVKTPTVADLLKVDVKTVNDYVHQGLFETAGHKGKHKQFDLRYILEFNIQPIKHKKYAKLHSTIGFSADLRLNNVALHKKQTT